MTPPSFSRLLVQALQKCPPPPSVLAALGANSPDDLLAMMQKRDEEKKAQRSVRGALATIASAADQIEELLEVNGENLMKRLVGMEPKELR